MIRGVTVVKAGEVTWPAPPIQVSAQPQQAKPLLLSHNQSSRAHSIKKAAGSGSGGWCLCLIASVAPAALLSHLPFLFSLVWWVITRFGMQSFSAYAFDVSNKRNLRDHCCGRVVANRSRKWRCHLLIIYCRINCKYQYLWWLYRDQTYA